MFDRENLIGFLLLGLCAVVGGVLVYSIATGTRFRYTGPAWLAWVLGIGFFAAILYGWFSARRAGGGPSWPDPRVGRRRGWRRWFGRDDDRP